MDKLQSLQQAKEQLAEAQQLIGVAIEKGQLMSIDRDLVLEKIRRAYENVIFEKATEAPVVRASRVSSGKEEAAKQSEAVETVKQPEAVKHPERIEMIKHQEAVKPKVEPTPPKVELTPPKVEPTPHKVEEEIEKPAHQPQSPPMAPGIQPQPQGEILADKFKDSRKFRNESIGSVKKDVASKMQNKPITDLTKSIGINDKFLYTKELFGGNAELYKNTIKALNEFTDINNALIYVQENFHWDENNEAASQLLELVRRKLLTN
jgi:hypothetical protein